MKETPRIVTRVRRTDAPAAREFTLTDEPVTSGLAEGVIKEGREQAWEIFRNLPLPSTSDEAWRRTDIRSLRAEQFRLPKQDEFLDLPAVPERLLNPITDSAHGGEILLLPGGIKTRLDTDLAAKGVVFTDFHSAMREKPELVGKILGKAIKATDGKFAAMTAALATSGVFMYVPKGVQLDAPLHSLLWGPGANLAHISHLLVYMDEGASATYVHESASPDEPGTQTMFASNVEIYVGPDAHLTFVEMQSLGESAWNFSHERVLVDRDASVEWVFGAVGSCLTKNFSEIDLVGRGATGKMSGFYFTDHDQHLDHDTQQNHLAEHTTSDLLFKGALIQNSRSVWQGMIYVAPGAQKTDGYQANRNLVLSRTARADSIPGLEILADDVRCTHGATVGKIDPEQIFYLMARGVPRKIAERTIVSGFFDPIMQRIPFEGVRGRFEDAIEVKMRVFEES